MKKGIRNLAHLIKEAKKKGEPKPIVFLGAGTSVSGGIPLADGIIKKILKDFEDNPAIIDLDEDKKSNYYELMSALTPKQRRALFQEYIKKAKVNIAHIYLAQLIQEGCVDYVLTVNFDDLLLRAAGLFNYTLPTYDISNVNSFTTTTFQEESIIYLHGQHYGEWLLNSKGELDKAKAPVKSLFDKICHDRTWIIVGYSGEDEVFGCIKNFSSFDNELYWVGYLDYEPSEKVKTDLLNIPTKNAHLISGYDADTFFLDLHAKLGLETPKIMNKPFSFLQDMMKEIKEPEEKTIIEEHKPLFEGVSERMKITNQWIDKAIEEIENTDSIEKLEQKIIDAIINNKFNDELAKSFENIITQKGYIEAKGLLSQYYGYWGIAIQKLADFKNDENLYQQALSKYEKTIELKPDQSKIYNNLGTVILNLAKLKNDENLYNQASSKYEKAIELEPDSPVAYCNWGNAISGLAELKNDDNLFNEAFTKYEKAIHLKPDYSASYNNWGVTLKNLAVLKNDEDLFNESFAKYEIAIKLKPSDHSLYINLGNAIQHLAKLKSDEKLYKKAISKYEKAIQLKPDDYKYYNNYIISLLNYYHLLEANNKDSISILNQAKEKALLAYRYENNPYNLSCAYALLNEKENALKYLKETLDKEQIAKEHVLEDNDWQHYLEDEDFKKLLVNY